MGMIQQKCTKIRLTLISIDFQNNLSIIFKSKIHGLPMVCNDLILFGEFTHLVDTFFVQVQRDCTSQTRTLNYCRMTGGLYNLVWDESASFMVHQSLKSCLRESRYCMYWAQAEELKTSINLSERKSFHIEPMSSVNYSISFFHAFGSTKFIRGWPAGKGLCFWCSSPPERFVKK